MGSIKRRLLPLVAAGALSLAIAAPAAAAPIVLTGGLVNVTLVDTVDISDVTIQVPVAAAANLCDIDINVLAVDAADGFAECDAQARSQANR